MRPGGGAIIDSINRWLDPELRRLPTYSRAREIYTDALVQEIAAKLPAFADETHAGEFPLLVHGWAAEALLVRRRDGDSSASGAQLRTAIRRPLRSLLAALNELSQQARDELPFSLMPSDVKALDAVLEGHRRSRELQASLAQLDEALSAPRRPGRPPKKHLRMEIELFLKLCVYVTAKSPRRIVRQDKSGQGSYETSWFHEVVYIAFPPLWPKLGSVNGLIRDALEALEKDARETV